MPLRRNALTPAPAIPRDSPISPGSPRTPSLLCPSIWGRKGTNGIGRCAGGRDRYAKFVTKSGCIISLPWIAGRTRRRLCQRVVDADGSRDDEPGAQAAEGVLGHLLRLRDAHHREDAAAQHRDAGRHLRDVRASLARRGVHRRADRRAVDLVAVPARERDGNHVDSVHGVASYFLVAIRMPTSARIPRPPTIAAVCGIPRMVGFWAWTVAAFAAAAAAAACAALAQ